MSDDFTTNPQAAATVEYHRALDESGRRYTSRYASDDEPDRADLAAEEAGR